MAPCLLPDRDDAFASCEVYIEPEHGCWCFGRARGGLVHDLA